MTKLGVLIIFLIGVGVWWRFLLPADTMPSQQQAEILTPTPKKNLVSQIGLLLTQPTPTPQPTLPPIPQTKIIPGGTHVFQSFNNCGPASLSMALSLFGQTISQQTLGNQIRPYQIANGDNDDKSVTLAELAQKATDLGYLTYYRPAGDIELLQQFIANDMPVITRTWLKPNEDIGHYRVIKGYDATRQVVIQDDSLQGKNLEYSYEDFEALWQAFNYEFLVLVPAEKQALAEQILGARLNEATAWQQTYDQAQTQLSDDSASVYAKFNQVVALYHLGKYQQAVERYETIESALPKRMLWYQIEPILAYYKLGNYDRVLAMSQQIFDNQNKAFSELHWLRGVIFQARGQTNEAETAFAAAKRYNTSEYWKVNLE